jgi:hypothetical protein
MLRLFQSVAVVGFFGLMMFLLMRDHVLPSLQRAEGIEVDRAVLADSWVNLDEWNTISLGKLPLGSIRTTSEAEFVDGRERRVLQTNRSQQNLPDSYVSAAHLELRAGPVRARVLSVITLNKRLELDTVRIRAQVPGLGEQLLDPEILDGEDLPSSAYELVGKMDGGEFVFRLRHQDNVQFESIRLGRPPTAIDSITPVLRGNMLSKNVTYTAEVFDPLMGSKASNVEIELLDDITRIEGGEATTIRLVEMRMQGLKTQLEVDPTGNVLRREIPLFANASQVPTKNQTALVFQRVMPEQARHTMQSVAYQAKPRPIDLAELRGVSRGQVLKQFSAFGLLGGNMTSRFLSPTSEK